MASGKQEYDENVPSLTTGYCSFKPLRAVRPRIKGISKGITGEDW